jgi:surfactin synthase thioesterase subunit
MQATPWLLRKQGNAPRRMRLFCFSYAGGSAQAYATWQDGLDPAIEVCAVQLPGRATRFREKPCTFLPALIEELGTVIEQHGELPFAFFGHSLGGLVAFELARHCRAAGLPGPQHLFASGSAAPQFRDPPKDRHKLPDDAFVAMLRGYNGTPPELLQNEELMTLMLPMLRADFGLVEEYRYRPAPPLGVPITVLAGTHDPHVVGPQVDGWMQETTGAFRVVWFDGDHFFLHAQRAQVLALLDGTLAAPAGA